MDLAEGFVSVSEMASKRISRVVKILNGAIADADEVLQCEGRLERFAHFWALATRQFIRYRCFVRASALSFSTLLALVPLLAVALSVTGSFLNKEQEDELTQFVENIVSSVAPAVSLSGNGSAAAPKPGEPAAGESAPATNVNAAVEAGPANSTASLEVSNAPPVAGAAIPATTQKQVAVEIHELVLKASSHTLGATGLIFLVLTAVSLMRGIEETFNDMWGVTRGRNWKVQIPLYLSILTYGPAFLAIALTLSGSGSFAGMRTFFEGSPFLAPIIKHVLPVTILSLTLGMVYKLTPNTKVEYGAAMVGGLFSGASWHIYNQLGFLLLSRTQSASKLYGGLVLVVLVMGGLYILWLIILFGAQIAYAYQNRAAYLQDRLAENVNHRGREFVALRIMTCLGKRFQGGQCPATVPQISTELGVPSRLTQSVLRTLAATRLVTEVAGPEAAFVPARPLDTINAHDILLAMRTGTGQELPVSDAPELAEIYGEFARIEQAERAAAAGVTLQALANRLAPRAELNAPVPPPPGPEKVVASAPVAPVAVETEKPVVEEPAELPKAQAFPEKTEAPEVPPEPVATKETEPEPKPGSPRRETARPEENTDFPL